MDTAQPDSALPAASSAQTSARSSFCTLASPGDPQGGTDVAVSVCEACHNEVIRCSCQRLGLERRLDQGIRSNPYAHSRQREGNPTSTETVVSQRFGALRIEENAPTIEMTTGYDELDAAFRALVEDELLQNFEVVRAQQVTQHSTVSIPARKELRH